MKTIHHILCFAIMATMFIACSDNNPSDNACKDRIEEMNSEISTLKATADSLHLQIDSLEKQIVLYKDTVAEQRGRLERIKKIIKPFIKE